MPVKSGTRFPHSTVRCSLNFGDTQIPSSQKDNTISVPIRSWIGTLYLHTFVLSIPSRPVTASRVRSHDFWRYINLYACVSLADLGFLEGVTLGTQASEH